MAELQFHNGQVVDIQFDEKSHVYQKAIKLADGGFSDYRPTHGITAPLATIPKPYLKKWAAKMATDATLLYIQDHADEFTSDYIAEFFADKEAYENNERTEDGKPVMSYYKFTKKYPWYKTVKAAADTKSKDSMELGTWLHAAIEQFYISGRKQLPVTNEFTAPMWEAFVKFDNFFKPEVAPEDVEFLVYSILFGYSGKGDVRGRINGKRCIGDWKTSNRSAQNQDGISVEYFFQLGGLAQSEYERTGEWVDDLFIANFAKDGGEPRVVFASEFGMSPQDCARAYVACFNLYHIIQDWDYKYKTK